MMHRASSRTMTDSLPQGARIAHQIQYQEAGATDAANAFFNRPNRLCIFQASHHDENLNTANHKHVSRIHASGD